MNEMENYQTERKDSEDKTSEKLFGQLVEKEWGLVALRGAAAIIFGIMAIAWPVATLWFLAILWGAYALVDGAFALFSVFRLRKEGHEWWPYLLFGIVGILAGLIAFLWPAVTVIAIVYLIGFWALLGGIGQIMAAIRLRKEMEGEWFLFLAGIFGVLFGLIILLHPFPADDPLRAFQESAFMAAWLVSLYAIMVGVLYLLLAFKLRSGKK